MKPGIRYVISAGDSIRFETPGTPLALHPTYQYLPANADSMNPIDSESEEYKAVYCPGVYLGKGKAPVDETGDEKKRRKRELKKKEGKFFPPFTTSSSFFHFPSPLFYLVIKGNVLNFFLSRKKIATPKYYKNLYQVFNRIQ